VSAPVTGKRFEGKVLLATGAASGIAAAVARRFAAEGGSVVVVDRDLAGAERVAAELPAALAVGCDVSDEGAVEAAVAATEERFGALHAVVAAAGVVETDPIEDWTLERWNRFVGIHLTGTWLVAKHTVPLLRRSGGGSIVNFSSVAAIITQPNNVAYGTVKAGILGMTRQLAVEFAPEVRVNAIAPGRILTPMTEPLYVVRGDGDEAEGIRRALPKVPAGFIADADEVAATACHLLSDEARFITGSTVVQDGGETIAP
jgi:NAD(P)-dependent dehydrogenase (short-subunit alcohol dehydrogenase family)